MYDYAMMRPRPRFGICVALYLAYEERGTRMTVCADEARGILLAVLSPEAWHGAVRSVAGNAIVVDIAAGCVSFSLLGNASADTEAMSKLSAIARQYVYAS